MIQNAQFQTDIDVNKANYPENSWSPAVMKPHDRKALKAVQQGSTTRKQIPLKQNILTSPYVFHDFSSAQHPHQQGTWVA